jgi:hypothetical protein
MDRTNKSLYGIPHTHYEQIDQFTFDLEKLIFRYKKEWDLPLESIVGAIEFMKNEIVSGDYDIIFDFESDEEEEEEQ